MSHAMTSLVLIGLLGVGGLSFGAATMPTGGERPDCPGRITCAIDGQEVCKDRCPVGDSEDGTVGVRGGGCCPR